MCVFVYLFFFFFVFMKFLFYLYLGLVGGEKTYKNRTTRPHHTLKRKQLYYIDWKGMKNKIGLKNKKKQKLEFV